MSRSGYSEDLDDWDLIRWRGQVASAIRGRRGQAFLVDLLKALEEMPEKRLIADDLENEDGVCAIGALGKARGIDMKALDPEEPEHIAAAFGIAPQLAQETVYMNDEYFDRETPEKRYEFMVAWTRKQIKAENLPE
jgi:hypothetical protein